MKKYLAIACSILTLALASSAQSSSTLVISGTVAPINTVTIASQSGYNSLALASGATAQVVGIATETSNDKLGYKVTLSSANAGSTAQAFLKGAITGNTDTLNYSILYNGTAVTLASGSATVTSATGRTVAAGVTKNIAVTFTGTWLTADTYSDTLTLTVAAN
jgi:glycine betaine/choline ABC-type transport system substrate-binding protein